ncbi:MAG: potassium channel family protein, partial [Planctomycetes bacterium]|nr:potassium channel family protein [Planctomycetota bacterium]
MSSAILYGLALYEGRDVTFLRCVYMVTITISTIGYEDMMDMKSSPLLMSFNIVAIFCYMILVAYCISNFTAFMVEGRFRRYFQQRRFFKRIRKMENHYIICGIKNLGVFAAHELAQTKRPFVVVDNDAVALEKLRKEIPDMVTVKGDPTEKSVLENAGIKKAKALIAGLDADKDNVYLVLEASELNPNLELAAKYDAPHAKSKLRKAGAKFLVCPSQIGGMRISSELIRPRVVSFLDLMLRDKTEKGIRVEQV